MTPGRSPLDPQAHAPVGTDRNEDGLVFLPDIIKGDVFAHSDTGPDLDSQLLDVADLLSEDLFGKAILGDAVHAACRPPPAGPRRR